jgi:type VI secretion system secreted protein Hcp
MSNVTVSSAAVSGGDGRDPTETVSFTCGKIEQTYVKQKHAGGSGGGNVQAGWDLEANKAVSTPSPPRLKLPGKR